MNILTHSRTVILGALLCIWAMPVQGQQVIEGRASVIDGDTIDIHGQRIRMHGIDAPESGQTCTLDDKPYRCGQQAALALSDFLGQSVVNCMARDIDRYGRIVASCSSGGTDLGSWMVLQGWALAYRRYSTDYIDEEAQAASKGVGIWRGRFDKPWEWRRGVRSTEPTVDRECTIKGNVSSKGERIYHVPGGKDYARTRISPSKGERWFCTEDEAKAGGWRRSRR
ncbi:thermonuclease family protein [Oceanibacterium hippocampi]|nr:thermonuclease family protein [Oceanibacterium hippocampi]